MLMVSRNKNLNPQGEVDTKSNQGKVLRPNCGPTPKLERPHINGVLQKF